MATCVFLRMAYGGMRGTHSNKESNLPAGTRKAPESNHGSSKRSGM